MKPTPLIGVFAAIVMIGTFAGCTSSSRTSETAGQYTDDVAITAKVKTAILGEPGLKSFEISVETYKDVVELSGFVDSSHAKDLAGEVAAKVHGVRSVRNELIVK